MKDYQNNKVDFQKKLIEECRKGSRRAQAELYKLYYKSMYNSCLRIVGRNEVAEDIMQESFLKAFMNIEQFRGEVSFGAWLKRIVINRSLDYLRQNQRLVDDISKYEHDLVEEEHPEIDEQTDVKQVVEEINKLPDGYRIVLSLYLIEGYDHDEISGILNISPSTSRSQLTRAKKVLALNLKKLKK